MTGDAIAEEGVPVGGSDDRDAARLERRRLIERLDAKEAELSESRAGRPRLSEEELEAEIEKERQRNSSRRGFPQVSWPLEAAPVRSGAGEQRGPGRRRHRSTG